MEILSCLKCIFISERKRKRERVERTKKREKKENEAEAVIGGLGEGAETKDDVNVVMECQRNIKDYIYRRCRPVIVDQRALNVATR
ncbi:hypothetical protein ACTXT7_001117 [Hymenolepis weldensis]